MKSLNDTISILAFENEVVLKKHKNGRRSKGGIFLALVAPVFMIASAVVFLSGARDMKTILTVLAAGLVSLALCMGISIPAFVPS